jgi:DNA-binding transcriptional MerR regulator
MSQAASPAPRDNDGDAAVLTIGQVLKELREEFPDVSSSQIRFYEEKGLVSPDRTAGNFRKFTARDVDRLRYVLRAKRDHFLPLARIREDLDKIDRGLTPAVPGVRPTVPVDEGHQTGSEASPSDEIVVRQRSGSLRITAAELVEATGANLRMLADLEEQSLLRADANGTYRDHAVSIVAAAVELSEMGLEPRHLRLLGVSADRLTGLVERVVAVERRRPEGKERAQDRSDTVLDAALRMQTALVRERASRLF